MKWNLFIDDERDPPSDGREWVVCRGMIEVASALFERDNVIPTYISFDHDLGENQPTGHDIARFLIHNHVNGTLTWPEEFTYYVHSQNPVGKANIEGLLDCYLNFIKEQ